MSQQETSSQEGEIQMSMCYCDCMTFWWFVQLHIMTACFPAGLPSPPFAHPPDEEQTFPSHPQTLSST